LKGISGRNPVSRKPHAGETFEKQLAEDNKGEPTATGPSEGLSSETFDFSI
jgi:hypothetical protein